MIAWAASPEIGHWREIGGNKCLSYNG